jgi:hypothetical protein
MSSSIGRVWESLLLAAQAARMSSTAVWAHSCHLARSWSCRTSADQTVQR